jgi:hypothetical protein
MADINTGEILEALNEKMDRNANNITKPYLPIFLVATQRPTAENNYKWYRLYSDGWVEQGGFTSSISDTGMVTLLITMSDLSYQIQMTISALRPDGTIFTTDNNWLGNCWTSKTTTGFTVKLWDADSSAARSNGPFYWEVKGFAA